MREKEGGSKPVSEFNQDYKAAHKIAPPQTEQGSTTTSSTFSSQKTVMDYVTLEGIENRTGIEKNDMCGFVLKELLDNALDFLETQYRGQKNHNTIVPAEIEVAIKKEPNYLRIVVRNSNYYGNVIFTKDQLHAIFDFDTFYSSKRNQYKISRGALGDAFKAILCMPYALAKEEQNIEWNEPLIIRSHQTSFLVRLIVDRVNQTIQAKITEKRQRRLARKFAEIEVRLPIPRDNLDFTRLRYFLTEYTTFNPHIGFTFRIKDTSNYTLDFPQVQPIIKWTNQTSIYYYTLSEFENLIFGLENNDASSYDVIKKIFREGSNIKKEKVAQMTVGQLKQSPLHINKLYNDLRNTMKPLATPSKLSLPFDVNKKVRIEAIKKRLQQQNRLSENPKIKYNSKFGIYHSSTTGIRFPFLYEIAVIQSDNLCTLEFTDALNCSVAPNSYPFLIGSDEHTFRWKTASNNIHSARTIFDILRHHGYSYDEDSCKKPNSIVLVNLISPRIDYKNYGKSNINVVPFAQVIADTTAKVCSGRSSSNASRSEPLTVIGFLRQLLKERYEAVLKDSTLKEKQVWTQSTVFYHLRPILLNSRYSNEDINREYITGQIKSACEEYLGVKRKDLGIIAADRAQLYFKGEWHDVGLNDISGLAQYGTDMLIVEKEGVVEQLAPYADINGIALLNTRGFLTEYASILSKEAGMHGCNVAILTDFDASGLLIAKTVPSVYRIGIDFETLEYLSIDPGIVEERYKPIQKHIKPLQDWAGKIHDDLLTEKIDYVQHKRIEIDSILAAVKNNARFWEFILDKLEEKFPTRNYNRAIDIPEYVIPDCVVELNDIVREKAIYILKEERSRMQNRFSNNKGFLDVTRYDKSIPDHFKKIIEEDNTIKSLLRRIDGIARYEQNK
jgi:hypothetical protein